jgi:PAS domain S-box-containing protein
MLITVNHSLLLDQMEHSVFATDLEGKVVYWNQSAREVFGLDPAEVRGKLLVDVVVAEGADTVQQEIGTTLYNSGSWNGEVKARRKDGTLLDTEVSIRLLRDAKGVPIGTVCVGKDITKRKKTEAALQDALREKELLLREVYHRVKNNLQVVLSLLNLQARRVKDKKTLDVLRESQNRIRSMALIHEKLHQSGDFTEVNVADYVRGLSQHFAEAYRPDMARVALDVEAADIKLDSEKAMLCGFIISELVSNALKHAFPEGKDGRIKVDLGRKGKTTVILTVSDNGVGLPPDLEVKKSSTLGLQLVYSLVQQLGGKIEVDRTAGTTFRITFS